MKVDIKDIVSSGIKNMDEKHVYILFGVILFFIFLLDYFFIMKPQIATLSKIGPEINILSDDLKKVKADFQNIEQYKSEVVRLKKNLDDVELKIRSKDEIPFILETISRIANNAGLRVEQVAPNPIDAEVILENFNRSFISYPIFLEFKSGYHNFGKFLNDIEKVEILFKVGTFNMASTSVNDRHSLRLTLKAIVYEE